MAMHLSRCTRFTNTRFSQLGKVCLGVATIQANSAMRDMARLASPFASAGETASKLSLPTWDQNHRLAMPPIQSTDTPIHAATMSRAIAVGQQTLNRPIIREPEHGNGPLRD